MDGKVTGNKEDGDVLGLKTCRKLHFGQQAEGLRGGFFSLMILMICIPAPLIHPGSSQFDPKASVENRCDD